MGVTAARRTVVWSGACPKPSFSLCLWGTGQWGGSLAAAASRQWRAKETVWEWDSDGGWLHKKRRLQQIQIEFFFHPLGFYALPQFMQTHSRRLKHVFPRRPLCIKRRPAHETRAILSFWRISQWKLVLQIMVSCVSSYYIEFTTIHYFIALINWLVLDSDWKRRFIS